MFNRNYFMSAKCTSSTGYCYQARIGTYNSITPKVGSVYQQMTDELKAELLEIRPDGVFEVVSFNRV